MDIGIDLGTTFSVIAVKGKTESAPQFPPAEYLPEVDVTILPSPTGCLNFPSALWWHPDEPDRYVFGHKARQMAEVGKSPLMFFKRSIGTTERLMLNGRAFTAREVTTIFLRYLKEWAEKVTGQQVNRAVITHPAYFTPASREEILRSAEEAGFNMRPEQMIMEPCAAALAYTLNDKHDSLRLMTYDLGGGTFDVAVMEKIDGVIQIRRFDGDLLLGGCNFDRALAEWVLEQLKAKGKVIPCDENNEEHRGRRARLLSIAEGVKIRLSEQRTDKVLVPIQVDFLADDQGQRVQFRGQINREQYAALIQEELQHTIQCCRRALEGAGMKAEDLNAILLVGGSTHGKWVVDAITREFGPVYEPYCPDLIVAAGAAIWMAQFAPAPPPNDRITLSLDYPSASVLPTVNISGTIRPAPDSDLTPEACRSLQVQLAMPDGRLLGPVEIGREGQFIFKEVPLLEDGSPSRFEMTVRANGVELLAHQGTVICGESAQVHPLIVLPRPLFLKAERMVAIAEEGATLPVRCQVRLRRTFDGPHLEIPILLDSEQIGMLRVEDIPDVAGEGCLVIVDIEITQSNEIKGRVLMYGPDEETVVKNGPVRVVFPPMVIPELAELHAKFDELRDRLEMEILHAPPQSRARLAGPGRRLVRKIGKMFEEQMPERLMLYENIKELDRIVNPPPDVMYPLRRDFENLVAECRELLAANSENPALRAYEAELDKIETAGQSAHETSSRKAWSNVNETLQKIHASSEKIVNTPLPGFRSQELLPVGLLKVKAMVMIEGLRAMLRAARQARLRESGAKHWLVVCEEYARKIDEMASAVGKISDDTPKEQALALIQSYLEPSDMLRRKIAQIDPGIAVETL